MASVKDLKPTHSDSLSRGPALSPALDFEPGPSDARA